MKIPALPSPIQEMKKLGLRKRASKAREEIKTNAGMLLNKVICARPLKFTKHFRHGGTDDGADGGTPATPPSAEEEEFLASIIQHHADFVLSHLEPHEVRILVGAMEKHTAVQGEIVIRQGEPGDYLYVVSEGTVRFEIETDAAEEEESNAGDAGDGSESKSKSKSKSNAPSTDTNTQTRTAGRGTVMGELALLYNCPRAATVIAETDCCFYRVSQETFRRIMASFILSNDDEARTVLKNTKLFEFNSDDSDDGGNNNITNETLRNQLASCMFQKEYKKGDVLLKQGQDIDAIYFIQKGTVFCRDLVLGKTPVADITLGPGENFGAMAVLTNKPVIGTVECLTNEVVVYVLTKERFFHCLKDVKGSHFDLPLNVQKNLDSKVLRILSIIAHSDIDAVEIGELVKRLERVELTVGDALTTIGKKVEPALYLIGSGMGGIYLEMTDAGGNVRKVGQAEAVGFGKETLLLSPNINNDHDAFVAALYGTDPRDLLERNTATARATVIVRCKNNKGDEQNDNPVVVHLRKLSLRSIKEVIHDPLRLGRDYRTNHHSSCYDKDATTQNLQKQQLLGQGTFGQVWLCREPKKNIPYALKIQYKRELIEQHQAEGVVREMRILEKMNHPFVMGLVNAEQDETCLYMAMQLIQGGELKQRMRSEDANERDFRPHLSESDSKFYAACMLEGLSYMHRRNFVYRDLKGENVLLDRDGYCVIVDLGFAKYVPDKTFTFCGTPIFIAPEVVMNRGHDKSADLWSLGVMIYEMLYGTNPFFDYDDPYIDQRTLFKRIVRADFQAPRKQSAIDADSIVSDDAKDLILKLLVVDVRKRLGCSTARGDLDIRNHPWFSNNEGDGDGIDFGKLYRKEITAPWVPELTDPFDGTNFCPTKERRKRGMKKLSSKEQRLFENFC